jgi:hypothetical protein
VARRAEIEQDDLSAFRRVAIVGKIWIALNGVEFEHFAQRKLDQSARYPVSVLLSGFDRVFDRNAFDEGHGEDLSCTPLLVKCRNDEPGVIRQEPGEVVQFGALTQVVRLLVQLPSRFREIGRKIEIFGQEPRKSDQCAHIGHVAVDAAGDAGILHLYRQVATVFEDRAMHLPDAGRRNRANVERVE